jgi:clan AA aspartic protease (TIGR02281 family)
MLANRLPQGLYPLSRALPALALALATLLASPAAADLYRWVDDQGRAHFTNDPGSVPAARVARLEPLSLGAATSSWNVVEGGAERAVPPAHRHVVPLERVGLELRVRGLLNDSVEAPFVVDTGATLSAIPGSVADALGIAIDAGTPRVRVSGTAGETRLVPLVTLRSLAVGGAALEDVRLVVLDSMTVGLLGMDFLERFSMQVDPVAATLTLEEVDAAEPPSRSIFDYEFSWNGVSGATRYYLQVSADAEFQALVGETWVDGTRVALESLDADRIEPGTYFWRIAAVDDAGAMSPWSKTRNFEYR